MILSVCLSVCPHDKTNMAETKIAKLGTRIVRHDISPSMNITSMVKVRVRRLSYASLSSAPLVIISLMFTFQKFKMSDSWARVTLGCLDAVGSQNQLAGT